MAKSIAKSKKGRVFRPGPVNQDFAIEADVYWPLTL